MTGVQTRSAPLLDERWGRPMRMVARLEGRAVRCAGAALLLSVAVLLAGQTADSAPRQAIVPRRVSLPQTDLPRGFAGVERDTISEPLRSGPSDADIVGVTFRTVLERPRTLEHLQSGPVKVSQM